MKQTETKSVSLVVPAYNEEKCLPSFLDSLVPAMTDGTLSEVIVINDGSTDSTRKIAGSFSSERQNVHVIHIPENTGKANAMAEGVALASGEIVLFLDADLINVRPADIRKIVGPLKTGKANACIASIRSNATPGTTFPGISGQRAYFRKDLLPHVEEFRPLGYGIEQFLSKKFPQHTTARVSIPTISYMSKSEKRGTLQALYEHARMWPEVFAGSLKKQAKKKALDVAETEQRTS